MNLVDKYLFTLIGVKHSVTVAIVFKHSVSLSEFKCDCAVLTFDKL